MNLSAVPADHREHLERRPFAFACVTAIFPVDELEALANYGNWLQALADGTIKPVTAEQEHFLKVDREEAEPATLLERAWVRLKGRREYEEEERTAAPLAPPEKYGIVDYDPDRCWW